MTDERHPDRDPDRNEAQLDALFRQVGIEKAPRRLTRRLHRIPREEGYTAGWRRVPRPAAVPRWVLVPAFAAALLAVGVVLILPQPTGPEPTLPERSVPDLALPDRPSPAEVLQARQDLALAFKYIDKAGVITGREIQSVLDDELIGPVKDNLSKHIPFTEQSLKEETS